MARSPHATMMAQSGHQMEESKDEERRQTDGDTDKDRGMDVWGSFHTVHPGSSAH